MNFWVLVSCLADFFIIFWSLIFVVFLVIKVVNNKK